MSQRGKRKEGGKESLHLPLSGGKDRLRWKVSKKGGRE